MWHNVSSPRTSFLPSSLPPWHPEYFILSLFPCKGSTLVFFFAQKPVWLSHMDSVYIYFKTLQPVMLARQKRQSRRCSWIFIKDPLSVGYPCIIYKLFSCSLYYMNSKLVGKDVSAFFSFFFARPYSAFSGAVIPLRSDHKSFYSPPLFFFFQGRSFPKFTQKKELGALTLLGKKNFSSLDHHS